MKNEFTKNSLSPSPRADESPENVLVPSVVNERGGGSDIFSYFLNDKRTIVVQGQVDAGMAGVLITQLKYLQSLDATAPIKMIINSPGGSIVDGLAIYDTMRQVSCPIETIGIGMQASMGSVLLVGGDKRSVMPNSQVLIHQGSGKDEGTPSDMAIGRAFHENLIDTLKTIYQDHTGFTKEFWGNVMQRDTWFTAEQALKVGLIQGIIKIPEAKQAPYAQDRSLVNEFTKAKDDVVARFKTRDQLLLAMNSDGADLSGQAATVRPELAVALAQFPEFWTATKKAENDKALKAAAVSNDNKGAADAPAAVKKAGPTL